MLQGQLKHWRDEATRLDKAFSELTEESKAATRVEIDRALALTPTLTLRQPEWKLIARWL